MKDSSVERCPLSVICPIVFIPGIMGSKLRPSSGGKPVWNPGAARWDQRWHTLDLALSGAATKRKMLVGPKGKHFSSSYLEVAFDRRDQDGTGYSGLLDSYQPFVTWLNREEITRTENCLVMIRFMVWAYPYNWTDSNLNSAKGLGEVVARAHAECEERAKRLRGQTMKPIVVTHSMGGLVSRAYTQILGKAGDVHGVIHGAMPTHGSPELYKRMRGGFEGPTKYILGPDQEQVTATAGNMPGPLELAPNQFYQDVSGRRKWLRAVDGAGTVLQAWPAADPYSEIYAHPTAWYRLDQEIASQPRRGRERCVDRLLEAVGQGQGLSPQTGQRVPPQYPHVLRHRARDARPCGMAAGKSVSRALPDRSNCHDPVGRNPPAGIPSRPGRDRCAGCRENPSDGWAGCKGGRDRSGRFRHPRQPDVRRRYGRVRAPGGL